MTARTPIPVVVLDRDGTVIEDRHYIHKEDDVVFYPGAIEALKSIHEKGYPLFLVSNQSGIGRGFITHDGFQKVHKRFVDGLSEQGVAFDQIAYCFHSPEENCPCRKPGTGLVPQNIDGRPIDWARSYVVGDHVPDMGLAQALGAHPSLVLTGKGGATRQTALPPGTQVFDSIVEFATFLPASNQP
jgi:D-glycero-D-manno-heptose 1,7-bisphosphate phosphatase